jgi:hypothetical protein
MKTEIKFETHELTVIRVHRSQSVTVFCEQCEVNVRHLSVARASAVLAVSETRVFRLVESGAVHWLETPAGSLLVCGNSISLLAKKTVFKEGEKQWDL